MTESIDDDLLKRSQISETLAGTSHSKSVLVLSSQRVRSLEPKHLELIDELKEGPVDSSRDGLDELATASIVEPTEDGEQAVLSHETVVIQLV